MRRLLSLTLTFTLIMLLLLPCTAVAQDAETAQTNVLMDFIQSALDLDSELYYEKYEDYMSYAVLFESEDARLGDIIVYIAAYDDGVLLQACYEEPAPLDRLDEISRYMTMINADLLGSKYYLHFDTGTLFYELYFFLDLEENVQLDTYAQYAFLAYLYSAAADIDYDTEYFMEIIGGETAENAYAMYIADYNALE